MSLCKTVFSAYFSRVITVLCKFVMVPILMRNLCSEDYAAFIVIGALEGWFLLLDFGLANSLQNYLVESLAGGGYQTSFLKTAFVFAAISFGVGLVFLCVCSVFLSTYLLGSILPLEKALEVFFLGGILLLMGTFGSFSEKILLARKKGYFSHLLRSVASMLSLALLLGWTLFQKLSLISAIGICVGIPSAIFFVRAIFFFMQADWKEPIRWELVSRAKNFWLFSCMAAFVTLSDTLIGARTLLVEELIEYNLLCKIFGVASFMYSAFVQGLMPECTEGLFLNNFFFVKEKIVKGCYLGVFCILAFTVCLWPCIGVIETVTQVALSKMGVLLFSLYLMIRVVSDFYAMALQSASILRPFFYLLPLQAILSVGLQYTLSSFLGLLGLLIALSLSYLVTVFWVLPREFRQLQSSASKQLSENYQR